MQLLACVVIYFGKFIILIIIDIFIINNVYMYICIYVLYFNNKHTFLYIIQLALSAPMVRDTSNKANVSCL